MGNNSGNHQWYRKFITECYIGSMLVSNSSVYLDLCFRLFFLLKDSFVSQCLLEINSPLLFHIILFVRQGLMFMCVCVCVPGELSLEEFMEGIQNDEKLLETLTESLDLIHHQQDPGRDEPLLLQHKKIL
uniref:Uncharacterized protein n=1 Tax=Hucho hucho TaxID=62062 RepID=A0A4W5QLS3_9TELE